MKLAPLAFYLTRPQVNLGVSETTRCCVFRASAPADASVEEAMERLYFLSKVERGLQQADAGKTLSHEEVRRRLGL